MALVGTVRRLREGLAEAGEGGGPRWLEETRPCPPVRARDSGCAEVGVLPGGEPGGGAALTGPVGGADGDDGTAQERGRGCGR